MPWKNKLEPALPKLLQRERGIFVTQEQAQRVSPQHCMDFPPHTFQKLEKAALKCLSALQATLKRPKKSLKL